MVPPASEAPPASAGRRALHAAYYALIFCIPVETVSTLGGDGGSSVTFSRLIGLALFGLAVFNRRLCFAKLPAAFWMLAWYLALYALSQLWIPSFLDARFREHQMTLLQMAALFLISANLFADGAFRRGVLRFYGWWSAVVALGMLLGAAGESEGRIVIVGQDPNVTACFFAVGAICIAGEALDFMGERRFGGTCVALAAICTLISVILRTGSRGGMLVFISGMVGLGICGNRASRGKRVLIASVVIGALALMVMREFEQGTATASRLNGAWADGDNSGRTKIYDAAWAMFWERPLLGYGGANNLYQLGAKLAYTSGSLYHRDAHNLMLAILTEVGLVGGIPFAGAFLLAAWKAWRCGTRAGEAVPFALMCAQLTANTSLTGYHQKLFWIVFAAAVGCGLELDGAGSPAGATSTAAQGAAI